MPNKDRDVIILGKCSLLEHLLFNGQRKRDQLIKLLNTYGRLIEWYGKDIFNPLLGVKQ